MGGKGGTDGQGRMCIWFFWGRFRGMSGVVKDTAQGWSVEWAGIAPGFKGKEEMKSMRPGWSTRISVVPSSIAVSGSVLRVHVRCLSSIISSREVCCHHL